MKHYVGEKWEFDDEKLTPIKAIRKMCLQCMVGDYQAVKECPDVDCPLWRYRLGHRPERKEAKQWEQA